MRRKGVLTLFLGLMTLCPVANGNSLTVLETKSFLVKIVSLCEEGNLSCDNVVYTGVRKLDGAALTLKGQTLNRSCETGGCAMYGYTFINGDVTYLIHARGVPTLTVQKGDKILLSEQGAFSDNHDVDLSRIEALLSKTDSR